MGIGLIFPGQASQFSGMGKELYDDSPVARAVFEEASEALSMDLAALCFTGTEEALRMTENTQPAIFTVSVAAFRVLDAELSLSPVCVAGHSLGEYSALVAAGVFSLRDAVRVLRSRGRYMQEAVPVGEGAMAAIMGLSAEAVEAVCASVAGQGIVSPANFNGGDQVVISGSADAVKAACEAGKAAGAKRALPLPVSAPFHCALMKPAADRLAPELSAMPQGTFRFPVVANVTGECYSDGIPAWEFLARQIASPVRWEASVRAMRALGASAFIEVGPGKVLSGLVKRIEREAVTAAFSKPSDMEGVRTALSA
ncbi:MAG TPA: ACP S-malonyltransferase [Candidatus Deferrimicrobiaceae bacterium]